MFDKALATEITYALNRDRPVLVRHDQASAGRVFYATCAALAGKLDPWQIGLRPARTQGDVMGLLANAADSPALINGIEGANPEVCKALAQYLSSVRKPVVVLACGDVHPDIAAACTALEA